MLRILTVYVVDLYCSTQRPVHSRLWVALSVDPVVRQPYHSSGTTLKEWFVSGTFRFRVDA